MTGPAHPAVVLANSSVVVASVATKSNSSVTNDWLSGSKGCEVSGVNVHINTHHQVLPDSAVFVLP